MGLSGSPLLPPSVGTLATVCEGVSRSGWREAGTRVMVSGGIAVCGLCVPADVGVGLGRALSQALRYGSLSLVLLGNPAVETKYPHEAAYDAFLCGSGEHRHPLPKLGGSPPFTSRWAAPCR